MTWVQLASHPMRTAVVTGSASGLGAAIRSRLETHDWSVIGVDLHNAEIAVDLSTDAGRAEMRDRVAGESGGVLDGVVACAGLGPHIRDHAVIASVNHFGAIATLDLLFPMLRSGQRPAAVAVASNSMGIIPPDEALLEACMAGDEEAARAAADATDGPTTYGTSKLAFARSVRRRVQEWGEAGVRLNAVAPGPLRTPLLAGVKEDPVLGPTTSALPIPLGREGEPEEVAVLVSFLLSSESGLLHGSIIFADGGTDALLRPDHA